MTTKTRKLATIFGGSGFIGTQLTQELARRGYSVRVAVRRPDLAGHVRMFGFPGQIQPIQANLRYPQSVAAAVEGYRADGRLRVRRIAAEARPIPSALPLELEVLPSAAGLKAACLELYDE